MVVTDRLAEAYWVVVTDRGVVSNWVVVTERVVVSKWVVVTAQERGRGRVGVSGWGARRAREVESK